jgi:hypothetical protein
MEGIAHRARSAPIPNADDFFRPPLHVKPSSLIINVKQRPPILIGPQNNRTLVLSSGKFDLDAAISPVGLRGIILVERMKLSKSCRH